MHINLATYGFLNYDRIAEESLQIIDLGVEKRVNEQYYYDNKNRNYEGYLFQYSLEGYGIFESSNQKTKLTKGKAFFITFPDESSYYLPEEIEDNPWTYFYIHFKGPAVKPFYKRIKELNNSIISLDLDNPPIRMFFELFQLVHNHNKLEPYKGSEWLYQFLISLLKSIEFPSNLKRSPCVLEAIHWMQRNYSTPQNIEDMCRVIGVSISHLTRQFDKEQGITPIKYLTRLRIEHSMYLLLNTDMTIDSIAKNCGFACGNYFSKVFKKMLHLTPHEYRRQHRIYST